MDKAPDAFRTISEVADDLDIPQHVLRFWETKFASVRPLKRAGGRRYYRPDDVDLLKGIRHLLYGQGYTIKGVQRIIKDSGQRTVQQIGRGAIEGPPARRVPGTLDFDDEDAEDDSEAPSAPLAYTPPSRPAAPAPSVGLPAADREKLKAVLDELGECRRILGSLRRG